MREVSGVSGRAGELRLLLRALEHPRFILLLLYYYNTIRYTSTTILPYGYAVSFFYYTTILLNYFTVCFYCYYTVCFYYYTTTCPSERSSTPAVCCFRSSS